MKKLLLTLVTLVTATAASAQIVIWNGDGKEVGSDGGFWNRANPTVVEDGGNKVLKITPKSNPGGWDQEHHNAALGVGDINFKGLRRISFRIKMADKHNVMVQLEGKEGAYNVKRIFWYDTPNEWQTMVYEYSVGPDVDKITDTNNNAIAIWPYEETAAGEGKTIYIDDIQLEGPMLKNGAAIRTLSDDALSGNIAITGTLSKGKYKDTWTGEWKDVAYDDYVLLNSKLSNTITSVDITGATVSDFDGDQFFYKNPNNIVYAPSEYSYSHNIVANEATTKLELNDANPFNAPTGFTATRVVLKRGIANGINTFCLPFAVTPSEVSATKIATFKGGVTFTTADNVNANTPFITVDATEVAKETGFTFSNKTIVATPASLGTTFEGTYKRLSDTTGKYGINKVGKFEVGSGSISCSAFRAYLTEKPSTARSIDIDGETTGISNVSLENPVKEIYNLNGVRVDKIGQKGIYIINGKKVIVK